MARASSKASTSSEPSVAELAKQVAALKKEVASLKKQLASSSKGGSNKDPRMDKLIEVLKKNGRRKILLEKEGL
jgi:uncharacterized small protein (DUF1192 family)